MKLWERMIEQKLRHETNVPKPNWFGEEKRYNQMFKTKTKYTEYN